MREIKFRAWDSDDKEMVYFDPENYAYKQGNEKLGEFLCDVFGCELQQYTGLKDKNGKEIYIRDILKLDLISGDLFSEVRICDLREIPVVCFFDDSGWEPLHYYVGKPDTCCEVVGNTFENPELLEVKA